jgi:heme/copper-type cytochrome/quinol oxidase subunit 2
LIDSGCLVSEETNTLVGNLTDFFTFINASNLAQTDLLNNLSEFNFSVFAYNNLAPLNSASTNFFLDIMPLNFYSFSNESLFFKDFDFKTNIMSSISDEFFCHLTHLSFIKNDSIKLLNFFPGPDVENTLIFLDLWFYDRDNECFSQFESSVPETKLYYPEPFIASPSFVHEEIWFIHILHYNYWLWFFFISLIMFYFITFINVVRWCNLRSKPKRETRGVSRSKCADLITACVPVSWAISIIISETVDATDYYDGFSTGEIVLGIRAYQWGWEYFYPKNIDLNYNVRSSYSSMIGNSIKYSNTSSSVLDTNQLWNFYQKKNIGSSTNKPASLTIFPTDNDLSHSNIDFSYAGSSISKDANAFKKIQKFSKTSNSNISRDSSYNLLALKRLDNLYLTKNSVALSSSSYGNSNQNSHSSLGTTLPTNTTLLDNKGLKKYLSYVFNEDILDAGNNSILSFPSKSFSHLEDILSYLPFNIFFLKKLFMVSESSDLKNFSVGKDKLNLLNITNKESSFLNTNKFLNSKISSANILDELILSNNNAYNTWNLFNNKTSYQLMDLNSPNFKFLSIDKNPRWFLNNKQDSSDINFSSKVGMNSMKTSFSNLSSTLSDVYTGSTNYWNNKPNLNLMVNTSTNSASTLNPIYSSNPLVKISSFDRIFSGSSEEVTTLLKGKEESSPGFIFDTYWYSYFKNIQLFHNYKNVYSRYNNLQNSSLPIIAEYSEYDFRNWQSLESLEDSIWESSYPSILGEEYFTLKNYKFNLDFNTLTDIFNQKQRNLKFRYKLNPEYGLLILNNYNEDFFYDTSNVGFKDLDYYSNFTNIEVLEDSYEFFKGLSLLTFMSYKNLILSNQNFISPVSYSSVFNAFRADFSESNWIGDSLDFYSNSNNINLYSTLLQTNPLKLRTTAKNSIVTYNAIQKVYKSRFDDSRSNVNFSNFNNYYIGIPFLTESRPNYESTLSKSSNFFFNVSFYNSIFKNNYSTLTSILNSNNFIFADLPFLISMKSDASRYLWFDWHTRWSSIEVQPSSIAKYSLAGLPYFSKVFEYSTSAGEELNDSENYLTKLSRARKNYMPNWSYSPFFYIKTSNWFNYTNYDFIFINDTTKSFKLLLVQSENYWKSYELWNNYKVTTSPSYSGLNRLNNVTWSPISSISAYYYNSSILYDVLTKREYLYRRFFKEKSGIVSIPNFLTVSPNNSIVNELKSVYSFIDPTTYGSEVTRELLYSSTNYLHYSFLKDFLKLTNRLNLNLNINFDSLSNYFIYLVGLSINNSSVGNNFELFKSQYRPMKKGIVNMIRLQATNAIAMPTEIRLHILASSKDVIHSWAIPSAGIKIDCVPGYSSHRVSIFLIQGIFWGQCMEICGRYHHWMPIVVYFMKRDLFFLWCTHFIHYIELDNSFNTTDKQLSNYLRLVSFDKGNWVSEINKILS